MSKSSVKEAISQGFDKCRSKNFALLQDMDEATFSSQPHPDLSCCWLPLGHITCIESFSLLEYSA
ncbi:hypothetical protein [Nostoc sp.]|uniref:hypothetical protein n=1 Tax=Nostoc sp. TaxID=1180 RepID=UPI002FFC2013